MGTVAYVGLKAWYVGGCMGVWVGCIRVVEIRVGECRVTSRVV